MVLCNVTDPRPVQDQDVTAAAPTANTEPAQTQSAPDAMQNTEQGAGTIDDPVGAVGATSAPTTPACPATQAEILSAQ